MSRFKLVPGLHDAVVTAGMALELGKADAEFVIDRAELDEAEAPEFLARSLFERTVHAMRSLPADERLRRQIDLANRILGTLREHAPAGGADAADEVVERNAHLLAITARGAGTLATPQAPRRPGVPLRASELLVNGHRDLSVGPEIEKELASADRVDVLLSFLKWSGVRRLLDAVTEFLARRPGCLRVITTAYMGATERRAIDELARLGAHVKVSYDTGRTRLHAKAWLFQRESGFSTALIGSSNLSAAALLDGMEWNVRLSHIDNPGILSKFQTTFEQYWADSEFASYDPDRDGERFDAAVKRQVMDRSELLLAIQVDPRPHQIEILESLAAERERGHMKNLVVAATGTGKTIVAAVDYKRTRKAFGRASLLFVAHREEILKQSRTAFQVVLQDPTFGEMLVAGEVPRAGEHVFASIQSLHAERLERLAPDAFDVIIVDEFHHAAAKSYEALLSHLRPKILLGLTATPERADGRSILDWFDGRIAAELRLWKALDQGLLSPFQYFGVSDGTSLRDVKWTSRGYDDAELTNLYTADDFWVKRVLSEVRRKIADPSRMRALGFCASIAHAEFMADRFTRAGLESRAVSTRSTVDERRAGLRALRDGSIRVLFSVDLFNEGVDLPNVDTVLFLRPTESATVFLQQLGRGLRRAEDKECLTALDFIGDAHRRFRFDARFRGLLGGTRKQIERDVELGFPRLPAGCSIQLDRQAQEIVLSNVREQLRTGTTGLVDDLRALGRDVSLGEFLRETDIEPEDLYTGDRSWTTLRRRAGLATPAPGPREDALLHAIGRCIHVDDAARLGAWQTLLAQDGAPRVGDADPLARMLFVLLGHANRPLAEIESSFGELWACAAVRGELRELFDVLEDRIRHRSWRFDDSLPLAVHAHYTLDEVLAAYDERTTKGTVFRLREGVRWVEGQRTDLLFVTLQKSEADYSPTTLYDDYPISSDLFHWESQSAVHDGTKTGQRYVEHEKRGSRVLLFVRERRKDTRGRALPYTLLGPCTYVSHRGARPMGITWRLRHPMPAGLFQSTKVAAG